MQNIATNMSNGASNMAVHKIRQVTKKVTVYPDWLPLYLEIKPKMKALIMLLIITHVQVSQESRSVNCDRWFTVVNCSFTAGLHFIFLISLTKLWVCFSDVAVF